MPSIIPGFEYDIFISYRQKDLNHSPRFDLVRSDPRFRKIEADAKVVYDERLRKYADN